MEPLTEPKYYNQFILNVCLAGASTMLRRKPRPMNGSLGIATPAAPPASGPKTMMVSPNKSVGAKKSERFSRYP